MRLLSQDFKKGTIHFHVTDLDDLWYLHQIIEPRDVLTGKTTRKIKIGEDENAKVAKRIYVLTIEAETIEFSSAGNTLRINGKIREGPDDIPKGSYHTLSIEEGSEITLAKEQWPEYQKQKLREASEQKQQYLLLILDREEAFFALTTRAGHELLTKIAGDVPKKSQPTEIKKDFQQELIRLLEMYAARYLPKSIIIASPAFYKDDLLKQINNAELKKKIVLATCYDVSERAIDEVLKRPELTTTLKNNRAREEQLLVDEILREIKTAGLASYGYQEVQRAAEQGNIRILLLTDHFLQQQKEAKNFAAVDQLLKSVDAAQGKIHLLSSEHEGGKKLNGLGGIAALLRYKKY